MSNYKTLLLIITFVAFISLGLPDGLLGVAWPYMTQQYKIGLNSLGLLLLSFTLGYLSTSINSGRLLATFNLGTLLSLSCALTSIALLGYAFSSIWPLLLVMGFLLGAGGGAIDASINTFAASHFSAGVVNWLHAFYGIGATLGPLIMTLYLVNHFPWYAGYITVALVQMSLAIVFIFTLKWWRSQSNTEQQVLPAAKSRETLRLSVTWLSILIFFIYTGTEISMGQWLFTLLTKSRAYSEAEAGFWTSAYWGSLTGGRILFGFILTRFSVHKVLTVCLTGVVGGAVLISLNLSEIVTLAGIIITGISVAPVFPSLISMTPKRIGAQHAANAVGYQILAAMIGGALLPGFAGLMTNRFGLEVINIIHIAEGTLLLVFYLALSILYPIKEEGKLKIQS